MRARGGKRGLRWTDEADAELRRRAAAGETLRQVAAAMGRTMDAVRVRVSHLKLMVRSPLRPWRENVGRRRAPGWAKFATEAAGRADLLPNSR